ncbi:MAG TPA: hypothetical protein VGN27_14705 [Gaiellaceae bacterium]|jgi:hypothetical protein|nr:hypothetical protein [Gaiellaceae bacterium]
MYATVRVYTAGHELVDALARNESAVRTLLGEIDGFRAYYLVRTPDGAISVSVYDTELGAESSTRAAAAWIAENLPELTGSTPQVSSGEVVINAEG